MATFTWPKEEELQRLMKALGFEEYEALQPIAAGSVNSNFSLEANGKRWFLRLYEEQGMDAARRERTMLVSLAKAGVPTPEPIGEVGRVAERPTALFPWIDGGMRCQAGVTASDVKEVGSVLAGVHMAKVPGQAGRFGADALRERLGRIPAEYPVGRLLGALDEVARERAHDLPRGLVHGDLFRDNVLWNGDGRIAAVLDFESAFDGAFAYDLAVTALAWCYGDCLQPELVRALLAGYEAVRPLAAEERRALFAEARFAAIRFTITRITDYAMRAGPGRVMKDWRRFLARLDALDGLGRRGFEELIA